VTDNVDRHLHPMGEALEEEVEALIHPDEPVEVPPPEQMSLLGRMRQPRTILSIAVPLVIIAIAVAANWSDMEKVPGEVARANPWLLLLAFACYYLGFPLRGGRWARLLRGAGYRIGIRDGTEIIFISWLVNCVVPAKLGDLYRAYLLKLNSPVSATRTLGTVFMERMLDLIAIAALGIAAGYIRFRGSLGDLPQSIQVIFALGVVVIVGLIVALVVMRNFGRTVIAFLPLPARVSEMYERFEEGVFGSVGARGLPLLGAITTAIWVTEALRLYFVVRALGFEEVDLGLSGAMFVALIGSLLTAIPFTPAGLGLVEAGMLTLLTRVFNATSTHAAAIVLVDRAISVFSVVVLGAIAYVLSSKPRGAGMKVEEVAPTTIRARAT
jgi:uncharacterized protein (TIRG00374 family)